MSERTRPRILVTGDGTRTEAYAALDWAVLITTSLVWGASFLLIAEGLESLDPRVIAWVRLILGAAALVVFRRGRRRIEPEDRLRIAVVGIASAGLPAILFALAEQTVSSAVAGMLVSATPIATAVVAALLTRRGPRGAQRWGLAVGFAGVMVTATPNLAGSAAAPAGIAMVLVAVFSYGVGNNLYPPLQQRYGSMAVMMWAQVAAAAILTPLGVAGLRFSSFEWKPVLAVVALGVLGSGIARAMHVSLVGRVGPARGAIAGYTIPVVALALGVLVRDEVVQGVQVLGVGIALVGAWLVSRRDATR
jgi:drug/metabolite transporter (DMT)-like permease